MGNILVGLINKTCRFFITRVLSLNRFKYRRYYQIFRNKNGVEIGGPSAFFKNDIQLYKIINSLDGVNFSSQTIWEGQIKEGRNYQYTRDKTGYQYICDAVDLSMILPEKYDFVLSCNNLEHIANPIKALTEWLRIIKKNGIILLVLPNKKNNFDHNRNVTSFKHLLEDYSNNVTEEDLTHLDEILTHHDLSLDLHAGDFDNFKARSLNNFHNRCLHHHVFDLNLLKQLFGYLNIEVLLYGSIQADFIIVGKKPASKN